MINTMNTMNKTDNILSQIPQWGCGGITLDCYTGKNTRNYKKNEQNNRP